MTDKVLDKKPILEQFKIRWKSELNKFWKKVLRFSLFLEIEDLQFSTKYELEFEYGGWKNPTKELELRAIELFQDKYSECFDMETSVEVISINKN